VKVPESRQENPAAESHQFTPIVESQQDSPTAMNHDAEDIVQNGEAPPRETKKRPPRLRFVVIAAMAAVILFAFIWEIAFIGRFEKDDQNEDADPMAAGSEIQAELNGSDWVAQEFLPVNEFSRPGKPLAEVAGIVIHYVGNPGTTAMQNRNYFANLALTQERYASSNFIIDLDGSVLQCVPVDEIAYASGDRNADTLSIELCHPDETGQFTEETYASAIFLSAWLCERYGITSGDIIRHYDATGKNCPLYFVENEDAWETFKSDVDAELAARG